MPGLMRFSTTFALWAWRSCELSRKFPMTRQVRDYNDVMRRLERVRRDDISVQEVAEVWGYPWFIIERAGKLPTVLLTGGMHGEEPGGVEGVLQWLESGEC